MDKPPVFIHSLFRAGSTYVFSRLRACPDLFCYYESMHELVAWASEDVSRLELETRVEKMRQLHHPEMVRAYFEELKSVWPAWEGSLAPEVVYGGYFAQEPDAAGAEFFSALCEAAPKQPVFSECRTAGRIATLKKSLGGWHAYLWRNPWDQWWSYQVDPYFDNASRVIAHADPMPAPLTALKSDIGLERAPHNGFSEARDYYELRPLDFETSYAWFYGQWLYSLDLAMSSSDFLINIDSLSYSDQHASDVADTLRSCGISEIDFSDAQSPVSKYTKDEESAFKTVEKSVREIFLRAGWKKSRISALERLRKQHSPDPVAGGEVDAMGASQRQALLLQRSGEVARSHKWVASHDAQAEFLRAANHDRQALYRALEHDRSVLRDLEAIREALETELGLRNDEVGLLNTELAFRVNEVSAFSTELDLRNEEVSSLSTELDLRNEEVSSLGAELDLRNEEVSSLSTELGLRNDELNLRQTELAMARLHVDQLMASVSWRITAPLRVAVSVILRLWRGFISALIAISKPRQTVIALVTRVPFLRQLATSTINRSPVVRRATTKALGLKTELPSEQVSGQVSELSPRGAEIYNQLARKLADPELPEREAKASGEHQ